MTLRYLTNLEKRGFKVRLKDNGKLGITPDPDPELKAKIIAARDAIIAELRYLRRPYFLIASNLLEETIAVGRDWPREYVGYTWRECYELFDQSPEMIRAVHTVKKKFPGSSVEAGAESIWWPKEVATATENQTIPVGD